MTSANLNDAHVLVEEVAGEVGAGLGSVAAEVNGLLDGGWKGSAAAGFQAGWVEWHSGAVAILDALGRMANLLAATARTYDGRDAVSRVNLDRIDV